MSKKCLWAENSDGYWETDCGKAFEFSNGGPDENHHKFCHCCGKPIDKLPYVETKVEEVD